MLAAPIMASCSRSGGADDGYEIEVLQNPAEVARAAAELFVALAAEAIERSGDFAVVLAGGTTPSAMFRYLAQPAFADRVDWGSTHVFWGDERCVPPDHPDSNFGIASSLLLEHVPIPSFHVHRIIGESDPSTAAADYAKTLKGFAADREGRSVFDLVLLGLGADGHTASLFPGTDAYAQALLRAPGDWVLPVYVPHLDAHRITLSLAALENSDRVVFATTGSAKSDALTRALRGPSVDTPASQVRPHRTPTWLVDAAARDPHDE
jgi:6-phosphogluconolactonase